MKKGDCDHGVLLVGCSILCFLRSLCWRTHLGVHSSRSLLSCRMSFPSLKSLLIFFFVRKRSQSLVLRLIPTLVWLLHVVFFFLSYRCLTWFISIPFCFAGSHCLRTLCSMHCNQSCGSRNHVQIRKRRWWW